MAAVDEDSTSTTNSSSSSSSNATAEQPAERIQRTLTGLDALLGVQEEPAKASNGASSSSTQTSATSSQIAGVSVSPDVLRKLADAEAQRLSGGDASKSGAMSDDMEAQFKKIVEKARRLADEQAKAGNGTGTGSGGSGQQSEQQQQQLRQEFESLLQSISTPTNTLDKDDIKKLKEAAFGPQTYFVTETQALVEADRTGLLIRGNLRDERDKVFEHITKKASELFGDKYTVLMVEDETAMQQDGGDSISSALGGAGISNAGKGRPSGAAARAAELNTPRVAFQVVPTAQATPPQTTGWKQAAAFLLALLLLGSCGQLSLAANIAKLPKETLEWFANPANLDSDALPPGLDAWDPLPYFASAVPIFAAVLGTNVMHELGHRIAASIKGVRLGPSYFVPNFQVGSFGAVTPFTSLLKDRAAMWDVSAAGPVAGVSISAALLLLGYMQTVGDGQLPADMLVPVPTALFQGSLLLGSLTRLVLGEAALRGTEVSVSPLVIAGWCGLIAQSLQLLPVGSVDGGRMVQAAFGKGSLALSSFFTYVGLGLGLLGSSLALPYGLYVIICQRTAEKYIRDNVTPAGDTRAAVTLGAILFAVLVLLPMAPELADSFGVGPARDVFF